MPALASRCAVAGPMDSMVVTGTVAKLCILVTRQVPLLSHIFGGSAKAGLRYGQASYFIHGFSLCRSAFVDIYTVPS